MAVLRVRERSQTMKKRSKLVMPSTFLSGDSSDDDVAAGDYDFSCTAPEIHANSSISTTSLDHFRSAVELQEKGCELATEGDLWVSRTSDF